MLKKNLKQESSIDKLHFFLQNSPFINLIIQKTTLSENYDIVKTLS